VAILTTLAVALGLAHKADSSKTVQKGLEALDNMNLAPEERVQYALEFWKRMQDENSIRSVTRRLLAWGIVGTFLVLVLMCAVVWRWDKEWAEHLLKLIKGPMSTPTSAVVICYFGYYGIKKVIEKFGKGKQ
jgi:hypothetical protein